MSTALKFRVDLTPSRWRHYQWLLPTMAVWGVLHSLSDNLYTWLEPVYFSLLACTLSALFYWQHRKQPPLLNESFLLGDDGSWQQTLSGTMPVEENTAKLSSKCRVTPFAIFLDVEATNTSRWVLKSECDTQSYRRLCRIVLQCTGSYQEN